MVIHDALVVALHVQPPPLVTPIEPLPPAAGTDCVDGSSAKLHGAGDGFGAGLGFGDGAGAGAGVGTSDPSAG